MAFLIEDHALIGDRRTAALVHRDGAITWLCVPRFDSPAVFARLLGDASNGQWVLGPSANEQDATVQRRYLPGTSVLETTHTTSTGSIRVTDLMPVGDERTDILRRVEGIEGTVEITHSLHLRMNYGRVVPWVHRERDEKGDRCIVAIAGPDKIVMHATTEHDAITTAAPHLLPKAKSRHHEAQLKVHAGQVFTFHLTSVHSFEPTPSALPVQPRLERTIQQCRTWLGALDYDGPYREAVERSALTLNLLTHELTGGIVAAPTTSLPEELGGERNWDYRYTWLRDAALTVEALTRAGFEAKQVAAWRDWLLRAVAGDPDDLQIMYSVSGGRDLPERNLDHLAGYEHSLPVRVGNAAVNQVQHDVLGEVMMALQLLRRNGAPEDKWSWALQRSMVDGLARTWTGLDMGLWEMRGEPHAFTHSRVMVWAAFDAAVKAITTFGFEGPLEQWRQTREEVRASIMSLGYNEKLGHFTQHDQTTEVDASLLVLPMVGFIAADDPRFVRTVQAIEHDLMQDGLILRYRTESGEDGLAGREHPFLMCNFWLVEAYARMGRLEDAHRLMDHLVGLGNDVGLLAEEYATDLGRQMGNFPQAFSHLGLMNAALTLEEMEQNR